MGSIVNLKPAVTEGSEEMAYLDPTQVHHFPKSSSITNFLSLLQSTALRHDLGKRKRKIGWDHCLYIDINEKDEQLI
jgi:hypothetical protein